MSGNPLWKMFTELVEGLVEGIDDVETKRREQQRQPPTGTRTTGRQAGQTWARATDPMKGRSGSRTETGDVKTLGYLDINGAKYVKAEDVLARCEEAGQMTMLQQQLRRLINGGG